MIFNFGSINLDLVYRVPRLPGPGETLSSDDFRRHLGGKGMNQSIAILRSGGQLRHVGCLGQDAEWLREQIAGFRVGLGDITVLEQPTGHAVIYVDDAGENQIVIFGGSNRGFTMQQVTAALDEAAPGDWVILQNETNLVPEIAAEAARRGLQVCYSAAPFEAAAVEAVLPHLTLLAVNEGEAAALGAALGRAPDELGVDHVLVTRGAAGAVLHSRGRLFEQPAFAVTPVDTTGAGDTFLGAFMAAFQTGDAQTALRHAAAASALQVTRAGAAPAIPDKAEIEAFLNDA